MKRWQLLTIQFLLSKLYLASLETFLFNEHGHMLEILIGDGYQSSSILCLGLYAPTLTSPLHPSQKPTSFLGPQRYTTEERLWCSADSLWCKHPYIWFGGISRVYNCPHKFIVLFTLYYSVYGTLFIRCVKNPSPYKM